MTHALIEDVQQEEAIALLGHRDQNARLLREHLDVTIVLREGTISIDGGADRVKQAFAVLQAMRQRIRQKKTVEPDDVLNLMSEQSAVSVPDDGKRRQRKTEITGPLRTHRPRSAGQADYVDAIRQHDLTFAIGPAGTGKTYLAVALAVEAFHQRQVKRIILCRPAVEAGEKLGFLPGDFQAKVNPYLRPLLDALRDMLEFEQVRTLMENDVVEIAPLAYMRGRTLNEAFIILDEGQNTTVPQMQMFLTRMGNGSRIVVTGDVTQVDLPKGVTSGLRDAVRRLNRLPSVSIVKLGSKDIVRHPLVEAIVKAYESTSADADALDNRAGTHNADSQPLTDQAK